MRPLLPFVLLVFAVPAQADEARAPLDLRVVIPRVMQLRLQDHPGRIEVTSADIARGEVVVRGPRVQLVANDRRGALLRAELRDEAFSGFALEGLPVALGCDCSSAQAAVRMPGNRAVAEVAYRLRLANGARAGQYRWPVTLSLQDP